MNHILLGPEEGLKAEWLEEEKKKVLSAHPDAEIRSIYVGDDKGEDLDAVLSQATLFSSFRFVIIRQYELRTAKDTFDKAIIDFLSSGQDDAEFVIISSEKSPSRISRKITENRNVAVETFWEMFDNQKRDWIRNAFGKEGFRIGEEAVSEVLFSVDNNTAEMKNLVASISSFFRSKEPAKKEITRDDIARYSLQTRGEDGSTLFQAIAEKDIAHAETIVSSILSYDSQAAVRAFSVLSAKFRTLESFELLRKEGKSEKEAFEKADYLSPYQSFYPTKGIRGRDQAVFRKAASSYPLQDTERIIRYLGRMDESIKNSGPEWIRITFSCLLATIILNGGKESGIDILADPLSASFRN